ncbi:hypothetical protein T484DRAFT_1774153 [Baffinella frigidus]|nr:hypothetical protein T484DRAFT_1774153 [Cryptophyta sp. CCMP2293]
MTLAVFHAKAAVRATALAVVETSLAAPAKDRDLGGKVSLGQFTLVSLDRDLGGKVSLGQFTLAVLVACGLREFTVAALVACELREVS